MPRILPSFIVKGIGIFAPAYDLLPSDGINGFRTTSINDKIEPTKEDLFAVAVKAGLNEKEISSDFEKIRNFIVYKY